MNGCNLFQGEIIAKQWNTVCWFCVWLLFFALSRMCHFYGEVTMHCECRPILSIPLSRMCHFYGEITTHCKCRPILNTPLSRMCHFYGEVTTHCKCRPILNTPLSRMCHFYGEVTTHCKCRLILSTRDNCALRIYRLWSYPRLPSYHYVIVEVTGEREGGDGIRH